VIAEEALFDAFLGRESMAWVSGDDICQKMNRRKRHRPSVSSRFYAFIKARQIDGTIDQGPRYGSYCLTAARVIAGWGVVSEGRCSYPRGMIEGISALPRLDLGELGSDLEALSLGESGETITDNHRASSANTGKEAIYVVMTIRAPRVLRWRRNP
jgi:hypothetical protein